MSFSIPLAFTLLSLLYVSVVLSTDTSFSGDGFYVGMEKVSRSRALRECKLKSMKLVSIEDAEKNEHIAKFLQKHNIRIALWTSGKRISEDYWDWLNGEVIYTNWAPDEPNGSVEDCIEVFLADGVLWNDQPCKDERGYICEDQSPHDASNHSQTKDYYISSEVATRDEAVTKCREMSMELTSIEDDGENDDIYSLLKKKGSKFMYWTSGYRPAKSVYSMGNTFTVTATKWLWLNEVPMKYFNWGEREPNGEKGNKVCIEVSMTNNDVLWNDHDCYTKRKFICEKKN